MIGPSQIQSNATSNQWQQHNLQRWTRKLKLKRKSVFFFSILLLNTYPLWCLWFIEIDNNVVAQFDWCFPSQFNEIEFFSIQKVCQNIEYAGPLWDNNDFIVSRRLNLLNDFEHFTALQKFENLISIFLFGNNNLQI